MTLQSSYIKGGNTTNGRVDVNAANVDNAGRLEISNAIALGEYTLDNDGKPLFIDTGVTGTGSATYSASNNAIVMSVTSDGDTAKLQTKQYHPYFPGHAQQAEFTFRSFTPSTNIIKRVGYYDNVDGQPTQLQGAYLESSSGTVKLVISYGSVGQITTIEQPNWLDPLDGTGESGITTDWDNFQVFMIDFLYLGGTYVNLYYIAEGKRHLVHRYNHANNFDDVIFDHPSKPIRAEVLTDGAITPALFAFICAQVSTMGATEDFSGTPFSIDTGNAVVSCSTSGTEYAIMGIRKTVPNIEQFIKDISITSTAGAAETYRWRLHINPTVTGTFTYAAVPDHYLERALGAGAATITGGNEGYIVAGGMGSSRAQQTALDISNALRIGRTIAGTYDELVLTYTPQQANQSMAATINGIMI